MAHINNAATCKKTVALRHQNLVPADVALPQSHDISISSVFLARMWAHHTSSGHPKHARSSSTHLTHLLVADDVTLPEVVDHLVPGAGEGVPHHHLLKQRHEASR